MRAWKKRNGERDPLRSLDTVFQLERKLRVQEAWNNLSDNAAFWVLRLSQLTVERECGMALLWKKASKRFMPQLRLPTIWKSRIADWPGRDEAGVRCLLCMIYGVRRWERGVHRGSPMFQYRTTLNYHISRDHFPWEKNNKTS